MTLRADTKEAVRFLSIFRPEGPWVLTAIGDDGKGVETETFVASDAAETWIEARNGKKNLYFNVNPVLKPLSSKAKKTDVRGMAWLHVDVDPRQGEELDPERNRIRKLLFTFVPPPTIIVDSGGGYQGFWKLEEEILISGDETKAIEAEAYNLQLELLLGADSCHNSDRIMRLPGTINLPNEKKRKKGRTPALAMVVREELGTVYQISAFTPAQRMVQGSGMGTGFTSADTVRISSNLPRIDLGDLPDKVSNRTKMVIVQGDDPDKPYKSQSEAVFAVACEMVRAGCTDDQIAAVLLDKDFAISGHIYRQSRPQDYAARQIKRARDDAISPELRRLNDRFFVIGNDGGRCRVYEWTEEHGRDRLSYQTFDDFRNRHMHIPIEVSKDKDGNPRRIPLGKYWLENPGRTQYEGITFVPGDDRTVINGNLNLWRGWKVQPKAGGWPLMRRHVETILAAGDPKSAEYILRWSAFALQHPEKLTETALVLKGDEGVGKGIWARALAEVFGQHGMQVTSPDQFIGRFNSHLRDVCLLFADEAISPDDKTATSKLKALLTEPRLPLEAKGKDIITAPNYVKVVMASNEQWVVPAAFGDRRFAVFEVSKAHKGDYKYFAALNAELEGGGSAAMLYDLLNMPLAGWHPRRDIPDTVARNRQKIHSLKGFEKEFFEMLCEGELPVGYEWGGGWFISTMAMRVHCKTWLGRDFSTAKIGDLFNDLGFVKGDAPKKVGSGIPQGKSKRAPRGYFLPSLPDARAAWVKKRMGHEWDTASEWTDPSPPY